MQPNRCFVELLRRYFSSGGETGVFASFLTDALQKFAAAGRYPPAKTFHFLLLIPITCGAKPQFAGVLHSPD